MMKNRLNVTPNQKVDRAAADYIASIWGKSRREFAYRYWQKLTRNRPMPLHDIPFRGAHIERRLNRILADAGWSARW